MLSFLSNSAQESTTVSRSVVRSFTQVKANSTSSRNISPFLRASSDLTARTRYWPSRCSRHCWVRRRARTTQLLRIGGRTRWSGHNEDGRPMSGSNKDWENTYAVLWVRLGCSHTGGTIWHNDSHHTSKRSRLVRARAAPTATPHHPVSTAVKHSPSQLYLFQKEDLSGDGADIRVSCLTVGSTMPRVCRRCQPTNHDGTTGHAKLDALSTE